MPLQATSGAASYDGFGGGVAAVPNYIEDVFSTYLYTGTGSAQTITNGIDLSTKGGLLWIKDRTAPSTSNQLFDSARGTNNYLNSDNSNAAIFSSRVSSFDLAGFTLTSNGGVNTSGDNYASWTFRKQPKFFDVVTWTGTGVDGQVINHSLGVKPSVIIVKRTDTTSNWQYNDANDNYLLLNTTAASAGANRNGGWIPQYSTTSTTLTTQNYSGNSNVNASGGTYVAYLFASNAGGFGLTGTDNVISCGSFTTDSSGNATVNLGYEPQYILMKKTSGVQNWVCYDIMRGWAQAQQAQLYPNITQAEDVYTGSPYFFPTATGFSLSGTFGLGNNDTFVYIAIRRGPMKVPTTGTSVFSPQIYTEIVTNPTTLTTSFATDLHMISRRTGTTTFYVADRLRGSVLGNENLLETSSTAAETDYSSSPPLFTSNTGIVITNLFNNISSQTDVSYQFRQAPSFMDVVCYTGAGTSATTFSHNLQKQPELIIVKSRNATNNWAVAAQTTGSNYIWGLDLNTTAASQSPYDYGANMSATIFDAYIGTAAETVNSGTTYVAYLFATCAGVSKVGSYTGTGTTKQIDCGFTAGARFVLIKRTDSTGDWYVWDTARGIVSGNDPYLLLNSTAAEVTSTDYIDTYSAGFEISSTAPAAINASAGTFIFLAIA